MTNFATDRPVRLLLINPALPESFWSFRWWIDMVPGKRAIKLTLLFLVTSSYSYRFEWLR